MSKGFFGRILFIDLSRRKNRLIDLKDEDYKDYLGGSGIGAKLIYEIKKLSRDPFKPSNPLMLLPGLFTGTPVPGANRTSICTISPQTGLWTEATLGGYFGGEIKYAGYDGIFITGRAEKPVYLWIENDEVEICPAEHIWGRDTIEADELIRQETDDDAKVGCIGIAGEKMSKIANIIFEGFLGRAAGRSGTGTVMGSKNLKGIAIKGTRGIKVYNSDALREDILRFYSERVELFGEFKKYGTSGSVANLEYIGDTPIKGFLPGEWREGANKIDGRAIHSAYDVRDHACLSCPVYCTNLIDIKDSRYGSLSGHAPEYETLAALGALCMNDDIESILYANHLCNRYGLDTISTGVTIAMLIEGYEKGFITKRETDGLELRWGDPDIILKLIHKMGKREGMGRILADGVVDAAKRLGKKFHDLAVHVKGLEVPMHDPRPFISMGLNYAVAPRGADHMEGMPFSVDLGLSIPDIGFHGIPSDGLSTQNKALNNFKMHNLLTLYNALGICKFFVRSKLGPTLLNTWIKDITGWRFSNKRLQRLGERIFNLKRMINHRLGARKRDDWLPIRFFKVPRRENIPPISPADFKKMLDEYYQLREWTREGIPSKKKMKELGIKPVH